MDSKENGGQARVLVTGSNGFIGRRLIEYLAQSGDYTIGSVRRSGGELAATADSSFATDIVASTDWDRHLTGVNAVIHLAARAHITMDDSEDPLAAFRAVNLYPTISLFEACQRAGVLRFVYVSSIGVNGMATSGKAFCEVDVPNPVEPYAISKWEAECALQQRAPNGVTDLVIVRPALVYGPYAKGNFFRLMRWIDSRWPIPLGSIVSLRSFVGLTNLCELLWLCAHRPAAAGEIFVAADKDSLPMVALVKEIANAMGRRSRLVSVPHSLLRIGGRLFRRTVEVERLIAELCVDASKARRMLGWSAGVSLANEIETMVNQYSRSGAGDFVKERRR